MKPRDLTEDWSADSYKHKVQHRRLAELLGEEGATAFESALRQFQKEWGKR